MVRVGNCTRGRSWFIPCPIRLDKRTKNVPTCRGADVGCLCGNTDEEVGQRPRTSQTPGDPSWNFHLTPTPRSAPSSAAETTAATHSWTKTTDEILKKADRQTTSNTDQQ